MHGTGSEEVGAKRLSGHREGVPCYTVVRSPRQEEGLSCWGEGLMGAGANSQLAVSPGF